MRAKCSQTTIERLGKASWGFGMLALGVGVEALEPGWVDVWGGGGGGGGRDGLLDDWRRRMGMDEGMGGDLRQGTINCPLHHVFMFSRQLR